MLDNFQQGFADPDPAVFLNADPDAAAFSMRILIPVWITIFVKNYREEFAVVEKKDCFKVKIKLQLII